MSDKKEKQEETGYLEVNQITLGEDVDLQDARQKTGLSKHDIEELADDMHARGMLYPLVIWLPSDEAVKLQPEVKDKNILMGGRRRFAATKHNIEKGKWKKDHKILVKFFRGTKLEAEMAALADNIHRANLKGYEEASKIAQMKARGMAVIDIAKHLGKSPGWVSQRTTPYERGTPELRAAWRDGKVPDSDAYELGKIDNPKEMNKRLEDILEVRAAGDKKSKGEARQISKTGKKKKKGIPGKREVDQMVEDLAKVDASNKYVTGMKDMLDWIRGELGYGEFDKPFKEYMEPIIEKRNEENEKKSVERVEKKPEKKKSPKSKNTKKEGKTAAAA